MFLIHSSLKNSTFFNKLINKKHITFYISTKKGSQQRTFFLKRNSQNYFVDDVTIVLSGIIVPAFS